jgi:hypothetical protein
LPFPVTRFTPRFVEAVRCFDAFPGSDFDERLPAIFVLLAVRDLAAARVFTDLLLLVFLAFDAPEARLAPLFGLVRFALRFFAVLRTALLIWPPLTLCVTSDGLAPPPDGPGFLVKKSRNLAPPTAHVNHPGSDSLCAWLPGGMGLPCGRIDLGMGKHARITMDISSPGTGR